MLRPNQSLDVRRVPPVPFATMNDTPDTGPVSLFGLIDRFGADVVGRACGVGDSAIRHWQSGRRRPSPDVLDKLDIEWPAQHDTGASVRESGIRVRGFKRAARG